MKKYSQMMDQIKCYILNQLLPLSCLFCQQTCSHPLSICGHCQQLIAVCDELSDRELSAHTMRGTKLPWQKMRCLTAYQTPVKELIGLGKFHNNLAALKAMGQLLAQQIKAEDYDTELVLIPVPLHRNRLMERGYNQAFELALPIAKILGLTIDSQCIARIEEGKIQHRLSRKQRTQNTRQIFKVMASVPKKLVIVDDVFTTGATVASMCDCLRQAGAETIEVWIIARTLKQSSGILAIHNIK